MLNNRVAFIWLSRLLGCMVFEKLDADPESIDPTEFFEKWLPDTQEARERYSADLDSKIQTSITAAQAGSVTHVGSSLGGGKTNLVLKNMLVFSSDYFVDAPFMFLFPTRRNAEDAILKFNELYSKEIANSGIKYTKFFGKEFYCENEEYLSLSKKYRIQLSCFCEKCDYKEHECEYWFILNDLMRNSTSFIGVHAFLGNIVDILLEKGRYRFIVIDENPNSTIFKKVEMKRKEVKNFSTFLNKEVPKSKDNSRRHDLLNFIVEKIIMVDFYKDERPNYVSTLKELYAKIMENPDLSIMTCEYVNSIIESIIVALIEGKKMKAAIPKNLVFFDTLSSIIRKSIEKGDDFEFFYYSFQKTSKGIYLNFCDINIVRKKTAATWILDATTSPVYYKDIFKKPDFDMKSFGDSDLIRNYFFAVQLVDAKYGMNMLSAFNANEKKFEPTENFKNLFEMVCKIVKKYPKKRILIISRKSRGIQDMIFENMMEHFPDKHIYRNNRKVKAKEIKEGKRDPNLLDIDIVKKSEICIDYYGVSRGVNMYDGFEICILFGGAFPNREEIKRMSLISGIGTEVMRKTQEEDEMNQSWGRIRPTTRSMVFVLSSVELYFSSMANTFKVTSDELNEFLDGKDLISREKVEQLKKERSIIRYAILGEEITGKVKDFLYFEQYVPVLTNEILSDASAVIDEVKSHKEGVDLSDMKNVRDFITNDLIDALEEKMEIRFGFSKKTLTSKRMRKRLFSSNECRNAYDDFSTRCNNTAFDGKNLKDLFNKIIYNVRFVMDGSCNTTTLLKSLKIKHTNIKNRKNMDLILAELVRRKIFDVRMKGSVINYVYLG